MILPWTSPCPILGVEYRSLFVQHPSGTVKVRANELLYMFRPFVLISSCCSLGSRDRIRNQKMSGCGEEGDAEGKVIVEFTLS